MSGTVLGAVFLVNNGTVKEAMSSLILGMGQNHWHLVERIEIGAPIFVYNYSNSMMYGCFKAITPGIYNLNPAAYGGKRPFPAQVKVAHDIEYEPVNLSEFQHIRGLVADGYKVSHELSRSQVAGICEVFHRIARAPEPPGPPLPPTMQATLPMPGEVAMPPDLLPPPDVDRGFNCEPSRIVRSQPHPRPRDHGRAEFGDFERQPRRGGPPPGHRDQMEQPPLRHTPIDGTPYGPDRAMAPPGGKTTLKLQNIPDDWAASGVADLLDDLGFRDAYDFFIYKPRADLSKVTGVCIINMVSNERANALLQSSRQLEAHWPVPSVPQPPWPVRWNFQQGWNQLRQTNPTAIVVDGSPSAWELPTNKPLFFNLRAGGRPGSVGRGKRPIEPPERMHSGGKRQMLQHRADRANRGQSPAKRPGPPQTQRVRPTERHQAYDTADVKSPAAAAHQSAGARSPSAAAKDNDLERRLNSALGSKAPATGPKPKQSVPAAAATRRPLLSFDETIRRRKEAEHVAKTQPSPRVEKGTARITQRVNVTADGQQSRQSSAKATPNASAFAVNPGGSSSREKSPDAERAKAGQSAAKDASSDVLRTQLGRNGHSAKKESSSAVCKSPADAKPLPLLPERAPVAAAPRTESSARNDSGTVKEEPKGSTTAGNPYSAPRDEVDAFLHSVVSDVESLQAAAGAVSLQAPAPSPIFDYAADFISF